MSRVAEVVINRPWWVVLLFTLVTGFFAMQLRNLEIDRGQNQLPEDMPARVHMGHIEERFGGADVDGGLQADDVLSLRCWSRRARCRTASRTCRRSSTCSMCFR